MLKFYIYSFFFFKDIFGYGSGWVEIFRIDRGGDLIGEILIFGVSKRKLRWDEILVS